MASEDSDTVLLNDSSQPQQLASQPSRPPPPSRSSTLGVKKCWICICDSTEDDPDNPPVWRNPCSCSLTAHESCLLDWVADLENPRNRKRQPSPAKIQCPQCKSEIKVARPKSYVVEGVRAVDRAVGQLVLPGLGFSILGSIWAGAWVHGFYSVLLVFGREQAEEIFHRAELRRPLLQGYGLIPFNLIFARTNYADFVLPSGTLFLLASQLEGEFRIDWTIWPPLPSTVFACLPAARSAYNWCYEKAFGDLNRKWIAEVQPRQNERVEGQAENEADAANAEEEDAVDGGLVLQLEVNLGGGDDTGAEDRRAENANEDANGNDNQGQAEPGQADAQEAVNGDANGGVHQFLGPRGDEIVESSSNLGQTILGALAFPAVAAGMGELLRFVIPSSWMTNANFMNGRPGLLRHKWGRSVVGGCLFVVLKDAFVLYCRWKMAQSHRQRKIMDYDKATKQYKLNV